MHLELMGNTARFVLEDSLCVHDIETLHAWFTANRVPAEVWEWDLSQVTHCDSAGLQWLLMVRQWAQDQGIGCRFEPLSASVMERIDDYRVQGMLGLATLLPASPDREDGHAQR
ncbi:STAS domain-containing protein [Marinobacteraceae bacterium S3BR75-40.1]